MKKPKVKPNVMLLTDCLPYELPLIISNYNFYSFIESQTIIQSCEIRKQKCLWTQPLNFEIAKNANSFRVISMPHPLAQLYMVSFIEYYGNLLIDFFAINSIFSLRRPYKISSIERNDIDFIKNYMTNFTDSNFNINDEDLSEYVDSYFEKTPFKRITSFYDSNMLKIFEQKYSFVLKLDYQDCFYKIYTHTIDWAFLGDKLIAKDNIKIKSRFSYILDSIMQSMNHGETAGVLVGPEFCRWTSEIVLCRIDRLVYDKLQEDNLYFKKDYDIVRFVDDIFVFSNSIEILDVVRKTYHFFSNEYKLSINANKTFIEERPFIKKRFWVEDIKTIYKDFYSSILDVKSNTFYGVFQARTNSTINKIKGIIVNNENISVNSIISYFLSILNNKQSELNNLMKDMPNQIIKYFYLQQLDIMFNILPLSLNSTNIIKYLKCLNSITHFALSKDIDISNESYHHLFSLLKYNILKTKEIYNLLITLANYKKNVPCNLLEKILTEDHYFSYISVCYYISKYDRKYKYPLITKKINSKAINLSDYLLNKYPNDTKELVLAPELLFVLELYRSNVLTAKTKNNISKLIKKVQNKPTSKDTFLLAFQEYIKDFSNGFVQWTYDSQDLQKQILKKSMPNNSENDISS